MSYRLGIVPYLNAVPLVAGLRERATCFEAVPSRLSSLLTAGRVDAALLPVAEAIRGVGDGYLGRHGIASEGPVESVLLFLRTPLAGVRRVLLDPASRTSAVLVRHLLQSTAGEVVTYREAGAPGPDPHAADEDAVLLIGDPALAAARAWPGSVLDLGAEWTLRERLPFVYARWTVRAGLREDERACLEHLLDGVAEEGRAGRALLARKWACARGRDPEAAARYVTTCLHYELGPRDEAGLARFAGIVRTADATTRREARNA